MNITVCRFQFVNMECELSEGEIEVYTQTEDVSETRQSQHTGSLLQQGCYTASQLKANGRNCWS